MQKVFESRTSAVATEKLLGWQKPHATTVAWSYDMEAHAKMWVERYCELANKKDWAVAQSLNSLLGRQSLQEGGTGNGWRTVQSMLSDALLMLVFFGTNWKTLTFFGLYTNLLEQSRNGRNLAFDSRHPSHKWSRTVLSCGKYGSALWSGFVPRLRLCRWPSRLLINLGWILCIFGSRTLVPISWMCKMHTSVSHGSSYCFGCWFANGWNPCSWSMGCGDRSNTIFKEHTSSTGKPTSRRNPEHKSPNQVEKKR